MTNEQARIANKVYAQGYAFVEGMRCRVYELSEEYAILINDHDEEICVPWDDIRAERTNDDEIMDEQERGYNSAISESLRRA